MLCSDIMEAGNPGKVSAWPDALTIAAEITWCRHGNPRGRRWC